MNGTQVLTEAAGRISGLAEQLKNISPQQLNAHLGGHPNAIAWQLWHTGREIDIQVVEMTGGTEVWESVGFAEKTGLGAKGTELGLGHSPEDAWAIHGEDPRAFVEYAQAAAQVLVDYIATLHDDDLDAIVDDRWDPPVSRGTRLVSIIEYATIHLGQALFILGAIAD